MFFISIYVLVEQRQALSGELPLSDQSSACFANKEKDETRHKHSYAWYIYIYIQESHCHKISPIRSSTLWGLSRSRTEAPLLSLRSCPQWCPRHCTSLYHTLSVLPYQRCKRKPRPNHSQEQEGPLPKWWLILLNAFTVIDVIFCRSRVLISGRSRVLIFSLCYV